jgi:hypothetical protein
MLVQASDHMSTLTIWGKSSDSFSCDIELAHILDDAAHQIIVVRRNSIVPLGQLDAQDTRL